MHISDMNFTEDYEKNMSFLFDIKISKSLKKKSEESDQAPLGVLMVNYLKLPW